MQKCTQTSRNEIFFFFKTNKKRDTVAEDKLHCSVSIMSAVSTEKLRLVLVGKSCEIRSTKPLLQILVRISQLAQRVHYTSSRLTNGSGEQQNIFGMLDMSN